MGRSNISILICALAVASSGMVFTLGANAVTTTGTATANVVRPSFNVSCDALSFGNILRVRSPGLVTVTPSGKRKVRGRVKMGHVPHQASTCKVSGPASTVYTARAPRVLRFTSTTPRAKRSKQNALYVSNVRMRSKNRKRRGNNIYRGKSDAQGQDELSIGATLYVPKNAAPGVYQGVVPVTIDY